MSRLTDVGVTLSDETEMNVPEDPADLTFHGSRGGSGADVNVERPDGTQEELDPRTDVVNHSPTGFEWGYLGSGPLQLAFAVLAEAYDEEVARELHGDFQRRWAATINAAHWTLQAEQIPEILDADGR